MSVTKRSHICFLITGISALCWLCLDLDSAAGVQHQKKKREEEKGKAKSRVNEAKAWKQERKTEEAEVGC